jgi:hypothetical protein
MLLARLVSCGQPILERAVSLYVRSVGRDPSRLPGRLSPDGTRSLDGATCGGPLVGGRATNMQLTRTMAPKRSVTVVAALLLAMLALCFGRQSGVGVLRRQERRIRSVHMKLRPQCTHTGVWNVWNEQH